MEPQFYLGSCRYRGAFMTDSKPLEIFSDYIWPWCYFITGSIERIQKEFKIDIRWTAFPLHQDTPEEGKTLEELFKGRGFDIDQMMAHLKQVACGLGLPFGDRKMTKKNSKWHPKTINSHPNFNLPLSFAIHNTKQT